ncbi:Endochitinase 1 [Linum perenne]
MENKLVAIVVILMISTVTPPLIVVDGQNCGSQCGGLVCPWKFYCCSKLGYCGSTADYCLLENGCQSGDCYNITTYAAKP